MSVETDFIPSPLFFKNDDGRIVLYLPAFEGEPGKAVVRYHDEETLDFIRSETQSVKLTDIDPDIIIELSKVSRILVLELDADKCIALTEGWLEATAQEKEYDGDIDIEEEDLYRYVYEASVSF